MGDKIFCPLTPCSLPPQAAIAEYQAAVGHVRDTILPAVPPGGEPSAEQSAACVWLLRACSVLAKQLANSAGLTVRLLLEGGVHRAGRAWHACGCCALARRGL